jgi:isopenicillin N synthase-like dioxygenase
MEKSLKSLTKWLKVSKTEENKIINCGDLLKNWHGGNFNGYQSWVN